MSNVISRTPPTPTTITGSTAETSLAATTLPTNLLTSGKAARMDLLATIVANATAPSVVLRGKLTGASTTTLWSSTVSPSSGSTSNLTLLYRLQASSSSLQEHWANLSLSTSPLIGQSTENYNQSLTWEVTAQLSSTSTGLAVDLVAGTVELVR